MISAQVVLINKKGYVLGVSRKTDHNDFGLPGGKMDPEDDGDPTNTAIRECKEETGLDISNLELVFAIHKGGNMGFTYIAKYNGEINHNEPHVVKWVPFEKLILGSFGRYNQLVSESLDSMGVKYLKVEPSKNQYIYAIDNNNFIHLTSEKYWKKNKKKELVLNSGEILEDLNAIQENSNFMFHNVIGANDEIFILSRKDNKTFSGMEEILEALKTCGLKPDKKFKKYIDANNKLHKK